MREKLCVIIDIANQIAGTYKEMCKYVSGPSVCGIGQCSIRYTTGAFDYADDLK